MFKSTPIATLPPNAMSNGRVDWVDAAKGICIIMVVMMHTTLGLEEVSGQQGWMHAVVAFSAPFRIPDFFLISGLFLAATIDRPWKLYLDRKVLHFVYFYVLWVVIQFAFKGTFAVMGGEESVQQVVNNLVFTIVQPFGTLWFIYLLPVFFVVTKLCRAVPWALLGTAAILEILPTDTTALIDSMAASFGAATSENGWVLWEEFCARLVYFVAGYMFASHIFKLAAWARANVAVALGAIALWAAINGALVSAGVSHWPIISLALGAAGALAIVTGASLIARLPAAKPLLHTGANSIVVYLAFFLPMIISRMVVPKVLPMLDAGTTALVCIIIGVVTPLVGYAIIKRIGFGLFLFHRPNWAVMKGTGTGIAPKAALRGAD